MVSSASTTPPKLEVEPTPIQSDTVTPLRALIYAAPKVGKTTFGLTFPKPLIINTDFGLEGDALKSLITVGGMEHRPDGHKDLTALYFWVRDHSDDVETIFIDSGDELVEMLLWEITEEGVGGRTGSASGALGQTFFDVVPEQAEYLANQRQMRRFLNDMRKLNKHMVISFGERQYVPKMSFNTSPGLQQPLVHWASIIGRLIVAEDPDHPELGKQRLLLTDAGSSTSVAGSRYSAITPYVASPTFDKLWSAINANR